MMCLCSPFSTFSSLLCLLLFHASPFSSHFPPFFPSCVCLSPCGFFQVSRGPLSCWTREGPSEAERPRSDHTHPRRASLSAGKEITREGIFKVRLHQWKVSTSPQGSRQPVPFPLTVPTLPRGRLSRNKGAERRADLLQPALPRDPAPWSRLYSCRQNVPADAGSPRIPGTPSVRSGVRIQRVCSSATACGPLSSV